MLRLILNIETAVYKAVFLSNRCASLGCWLKVQLKSASITPKFHVLTYHMPQKVQLQRTIMMGTEHSSEKIDTHTVVNSLNHTYHTVQNVRKSLELVFNPIQARLFYSLKVQEGVFRDLPYDLRNH